MEFRIFSLIIFLVTGVIIYLEIMLGEPDSKWNKKRLYNRTWDIRYTCRQLKVKEINVENKGFLFSVRVEDGNGVESIGYKSPYKATDIYINDELVCKIHTLKNLFTMYITVEYVKERKGSEIYEIITKAYKISKKKLNEHYKTNGYGINLKSFYND